jgi:homoserine kinase
MHLDLEIPASVANLGPGFDALGMAVALYNRYSFTISDQPGINISISGEGAGLLPKDEQHLVYRAYVATLQRLGQDVPPGFGLEQHNHVPFAGGLGNSATAVVAGVLAANAVAGEPLNAEQLLLAATAIEGHPDNVVPALVGGLVTCVYEAARVTYVSIPLPDACQVVLAVPDFSVNTALARQVLPSHIPLTDASYNVSHVSLLVAALYTGQWQTLAQAMQDKLHQPYRAHLIPGLRAVCDAALNAGAVGAALAGAGPTVMALTTDAVVADSIGKAMTDAFLAAGVSARCLITTPCLRGASVVDNRDIAGSVNIAPR